MDDEFEIILKEDILVYFKVQYQHSDGRKSLI